MSFGISAVTAGYIAAGVAVAATTYSAIQTKQSAKMQANAIKNAQDEQDRDQREAETDAAVAANQQEASRRRGRRQSTLSTQGTLGSQTALGSSASTTTTSGG